MQRHEIGCPKPETVFDKKLPLQEEILGDERLRTAMCEQFGNRGQDVDENNK